MKKDDIIKSQQLEIEQLEKIIQKLIRKNNVLLSGNERNDEIAFLEKHGHSISYYDDMREYLR